MIRHWKQYRAYWKARRDHPAGKGAYFGPTRSGTDGETRAAVEQRAEEIDLADIFADGYRQGVEDAEQSMLYSIAYLPDNVDPREFVLKLIEGRRKRDPEELRREWFRDDAYWGPPGR